MVQVECLATYLEAFSEKNNPASKQFYELCNLQIALSPLDSALVETREESPDNTEHRAT